MRIKVIVMLLVVVGTASHSAPVKPTAKMSTHPLGILSGDGGLMLVSLPDGHKRSVAKQHSVSSFCFSPDGTRMALLASPSSKPDDDQNVWELTLSTGKVRKVTTRFPGADVIAWRPGSNQVAASSGPLQTGVDGDGGVWLINMQTGSKKRLVVASDADFPMSRKLAFSSDGRFLAVDRGGSHLPVLEVDKPGRWFGLDRPDALMHLENETEDVVYGYTDIIWAPQGHRLLISSGGRGIWEWNLDGCHAGVKPVSDLSTRPRNGNLKKTSAQLVTAKGKVVYCLGIDRSGDIVYLTDSGLWRKSVGKKTPVSVLKSSEVPNLKVISDDMAETGGVGVAKKIRLSPDGRYAFLTTWSTGSLVDLTRSKILPFTNADDSDGSW